MTRNRFTTSLPAVALLVYLIWASGNPISFLMVLGALAIHEFCHSWVGKSMGYPSNLFSLTIWGVRLHMDPLGTMQPITEGMIAVSGPFANGLMAAASFGIESLLGINSPFLILWGKINLLLASVNLIPALPLDGGHILHAWVKRNFGHAAAKRVCRFVAGVCVGLLGMGGAVSLITGRGGSLFLFVGGFIFFHWINGDAVPNVSPWQLLQYKKKRLAKVGSIPLRMVLVSPDMPVKKALQESDSHNYLLFFLSGAPGEWSVVSEESAWDALVTHGAGVTFFETIQAGFTVTLQKVKR